MVSIFQLHHAQRAESVILSDRLSGLATSVRPFWRSGSLSVGRTVGTCVVPHAAHPKLFTNVPEAPWRKTNRHEASLKDPAEWL
jgi:hypothetical protein